MPVHYLQSRSSWTRHAGQLEDRVVMWQVAIHMVFVVSAMAMAYTDKLMTQTLVLNKQHH